MTTLDPAELARTLADAERICSVPAPTNDEGRRAEFVAGLLRDEGATPRSDDAGNVLATFGTGDDADAVVFAAHLDTVFAAGTDVMPRRDGDRIAAPGIGDNSLGVAALLHLARGLRDRPLTRQVVLAATVGEEGLGDLRGAKTLVAARPWGAFVAVEGMEVERLVTAAVGSLRYRITLTGPGGHPWGDRGTPSAAHELLGPLQEILAATASAGVSTNVGGIAGGTAINVIAAQASADLDLRCENAAGLEEAERIVRGAFDRLPEGVTAAVEKLGHRPGGRIDPAAELLRAARRARERAGLPAAEEDASSTDANAAHGESIPAITVGITVGANAHRLDEYIETGPAAGGLAALDALLDELAGAS